ncbi:MAG: domain containing protein [Myxococcales bacterium]|nr:domain containing protein [Myxococcales bacterium]
MFKLVIQDDEGKTTVVPLIRDEITIGRKEGNTIRLTERNVSRRHARILRNNGEVQIEDLGSYNGIRVNNSRIAERVSLRVSDQVQIGDYKLYLKAEGVEQVDDARTMPIERIETPTEAMPSVNNNPTAQLPAQAPPAAAAAPAPASRSQVATADTDPAGRPVATAAQVAALNPTTGYGKLVVVSSNFAGKEFDLTRPQMIIGRTDENDLVVNHRSISRNHAKVTRDPETSRYTISDLQSSNGVRVNGQDYGKVELRRGDTVDLGHVRLRFVEPGEDFVFSRDAVIADVPEAGGRRGMFVAIILAVVVLGGVGAFFALKGGKEATPVANPTNGSTGKVERPVGEVGSDATTVAVGSNPVAAEIDAGSASTMVANPTNDNDLKVECMKAATDRKWTDLRDCANRLQKTDPAAAKDFLDTAKSELNNDARYGKLIEEIKNKSLLKANKILDSIDESSVYKKQAQTMFDTLENGLIADATRTARNDVKLHKCADLDQYITQIQQSQGSKVADAARAFKCEQVAANPDHVNPNPNQNHTGSNTVPVIKDKEPPCDAADLAEKGKANINVSAFAAALSNFEASLKCKKDPNITKLAFMAACRGSNLNKAKQYYGQLPPAAQNTLVQMCLINKIDPR